MREFPALIDYVQPADGGPHQRNEALNPRQPRAKNDHHHWPQYTTEPQLSEDLVPNLLHSSIYTDCRAYQHPMHEEIFLCL